METFDSFALTLPIMALTVSAVFMVLWRFGLKAALFWGLGFGCSGLGFLTSLPLASDEVMAMAGDMLFVFGFLSYGQALLTHFGATYALRYRLLLIGLYFAVDVYLVFGLADLRSELLLNDLVAALLLGLPLTAVVQQAFTPADRLVVAAASLVVIETLGRVIAINYLVGDNDDLAAFGESVYAVVIQITGGCFGVLLAAAAFGSMVMRVMLNYRRAAEIDPLTGLYNRRGLDQALRPAQGREAWSGVIVVTDIDHFKQVNDRFGHAAGDRVIAAFALEIRTSIPAGAVAARLGGEEFVICIPNAGLAEAGVLAHGIRLRFAGRDWRQFGIDRQITASFGVAKMQAENDNLQAALDRADQCLYEAKGAGRNMVVVEGGVFETGEAMIADLQAALTALKSAGG
ncbi:diguanylate cyclase (GGDEF)-like protein [Rhizobium sp. SG_E_25_P2]|uniref:GGDEF domain-containing protein n=1 Tax=Rhizobium sp. SG_E_25_P2 TaxID=2879942 RepID=UPI002474A287|nr:GGDEF domain-containing protein [Rhizobium sp. SG_E_25_P2]MDH6265004.1 diguanylate cyclase (GGDEF)-like protein [Rhizobium sp. SG_E_25_P2]